MVLLHRRFPLVGLFLLGCGQFAFGGSYSDLSGFSFSYPDGWVPVTHDAMGDVDEAVPGVLKDWISKNNVDLDQVKVVLIRNGRDEFLENLNVVVNEQQIPVDNETVRKLTGVIAQQYKTMGVRLDKVQGRVQKFGSRDAIVMEYQMQLPGVPGTLRQKQVSFPGGGKTYIVTCTAQVNSFDKYEPTFDNVLGSFQAPAPVARGLDWIRVVIMGMVGGIIGALIWIVRMFSSRAKPGDDGGTFHGAGKSEGDSGVADG